MGSSASTTQAAERRTMSADGIRPVDKFHRMSLPASMATYHRIQLPPPPRPLATRKNDIFRLEDYRFVDEYVLQIPPELNRSTFRELVEFLTAPLEGTDLERVRAIFRWVTSVDVFSVQMDTPPPRNSPIEYFYKIQTNQGNHAHLLSGLCQMAGLPCVVLSGMNKSAAYEIGKKADRNKMGAQWNAVYVDGNWRLIDAFWACACVVGKKSGEWTLVDADGDVQEDDEKATEGVTQHRINEFFFLTDPDHFILTHFPDDPKWQLLEKPLTMKDFENHFYVRECFHILGLSIVKSTKKNCVVETEDGEIDFCFGLPPGRSSTYRFKYMLYRSRSDPIEQKVDLFLDRFVMFEQREDLLRFALRFPIKGSFKMDIYGLDTTDGDVFDLCCTYIINCPHAKPNCLPLPDCPPLGWGPVAQTKEAGLTPKTHKQAEVTSKDGYVEIRLSKDRALAFHQLLKHAAIDEATLSKYVVTQFENDEIVVYLRLPQKGEYALELFAQGLEEEGAASNALNYLINCSNTETGSQPFPNVTNGVLGRNHVTCKKFGVGSVQPYQGMLESNDGKLSLEFTADPDVELLGELHTNDGNAFHKMSSSVTNKGGKWKFDLNMPVKGEYSINVFARKKEDDGRQIYSVYSYIIKSAGTGGGAKDEPDAEGENMDTAVPTETVETSDDEVMIPVPYGCEKAVATVHRRNGNDPPDPKQIEFLSADDMNLVKVQLKDYGEYMLNIYSLDENANLVQNVAKYQINRKRPGELYQNNLKNIMEDITNSRQNTSESLDNKKDNSEEQNKRQARKLLHNAIDLKDPRSLEEAIKRCKDSGVPENDPLFLKAKHLLEILEVKEELIAATQKRNLAVLDKAIEHAKSINSGHELDLQIAMAIRLRDHLAKIEKLRHAVLNMESKTVSEIKSYTNPPDGVHQCLMATFLLLGHPLKDLNAWPRVQALMGKTGKESIMRKISQFDAQAVPIKSAQTAKKIIEPYNREQIRDVSAGAATFYIWAVGMIEEVESYGGSEQNDPMRLKK
ncbi:uncharacterized protein LOC106062437 isoform X1 [Biomphalaria glabrata]|uniref:Uncharacterized protein LOC106062437 isoform X1 n=2 Tax=Biomphalaria glabrata TaxID=6526 RepID=A0A9W3AG16_BIOGL|nr:uncharacterized protein LOC106062437 isoform X1 [Biomphalaria glabrata]XP_055886105.1 uncharacterized protein LOC106062437 isoform X1 [Biomphalaria glabrata]XP_055886106.1 uncharacterized protein LOC106062437 isoform X1 [Biomphalaria glabrata]XP_055886107.1 uncharacterized protein LOC106062437 isoform X1 [Biomphalaria glabrata]XP_055886108.1 uncharacterized protein LOC106062437 isoform X1 [Biomphalaria glabrata]XP_055886110.1 uncharacterized protein LOC106062437 isoform X1 [Biomphalaria gla